MTLSTITKAALPLSVVFRCRVRVPMYGLRHVFAVVTAHTSRCQYIRYYFLQYSTRSAGNALCLFMKVLSWTWQTRNTHLIKRNSNKFYPGNLWLSLGRTDCRLKCSASRRGTRVIAGLLRSSATHMSMAEDWSLHIPHFPHLTSMDGGNATEL